MSGEGERAVHHKRGRAKKQRAGCLSCKPHKGNGSTVERPAVERQADPERPTGTRKKDRRKWCRGRVGVEHKLVVGKRAEVWGSSCWARWCESCGKVLDRWREGFRYYGDRPSWVPEDEGN